MKPQHIVVERSFPVRASVRCQQLVGCKQASPDRSLPFMCPFDTKLTNGAEKNENKKKIY